MIAFGAGRIPLHRPSLLVSVRSAQEARAAMAGGASIIDIKEPTKGPLGRADVSVWRDIRAAVPDEIPISVALGELHELPDRLCDFQTENAWTGIAFRKIGLAAAGLNWAEHWRMVRQQLDRLHGSRVPWIAVVYSDWESAQAPEPAAVLDVALQVDECQGVLIDTWNKSHASELGLGWKDTIARIRDAGRLVALAGSLDLAAIDRLRLLRPDIFAVRGAACALGDRLGTIDPDRVAALVRTIG